MLEGTCPVCGNRIEARSRDEWPTFPFCNERCRLVDLGRWLDEQYRISEPLTPTDEESAEGDAEPE